MRKYINTKEFIGGETMQNINKITADNKENFYKILNIRLEGMLSAEKDSLANLANSAAHLFNNLESVNWSGFYLMKDGELVLGPFCGKPACTRIKVGKGVCGTAVSSRKANVVPNVHEFEGHIACDGASSSEIVIPIIKDDIIYGVLDIDSPDFGTFDETDRVYLEKFVEKLNKYIDWSLFTRV
jgi:GAF domain-containing protein